MRTIDAQTVARAIWGRGGYAHHTPSAVNPHARFRVGRYALGVRVVDGAGDSWESAFNSVGVSAQDLARHLPLDRIGR